jgi:hypothetical protein
MRVVSQSTTSLMWAATFEPFKAELPAAAADWIEFGHVEPPVEAKAVAREWWRRDASASELHAAWPEPFVREVYVRGAHLDLATSGALRTAMSFDVAHTPVLQARVRAQEAEVVGGVHTLRLVVPESFQWADVVELRKHRALVEYRAVLREVEAAVLNPATSTADLERVIRDEYARRVEEAASKRTARWASVGLAGIGLVTGIGADVALSGSPGAGTAAAAVITAGELAIGGALDRRATPRWLAVHSRLRRRPR